MTEDPGRPRLPTEADVELFDAVAPLIQSAYDEISILAKKSPVTKWTPTAKIAELLDTIKPVLAAYEPGAKYLDPVTEQMSNGNVAFTLRQWLTVVGQFRTRYFRGFIIEGGRPRWVTVENPPAEDL